MTTDLHLLERFRHVGALLDGHFLLSSGLHSPVYFQSALVLQHPAEAGRLGAQLAREVRSALGSQWPERGGVVVAPAVGGIVIGHELARALGARGLFAERQEGRMSLRRGFHLEPGEPVIVCEDVITTGGSAREVAELVLTLGARLTGVAALIHRGSAPLDLGAPVVTLARLETTTYAPSACPQCAAGIPVVKPGSRIAAGSSPVRADLASEPIRP